MEFILPEGFEEKIKNLIQGQWEQFRYCYENNRYQSLRLNPLKLDKSDYEHILTTVGASGEMVPWEENGRYYDEKSHPGKHPYHEMGLYYIQEPSAMSAASLLSVEPGMRVLDLCAAPGGKSTQLASYLGQQGLLVSNEINNSRCRILSSNIERLGVRNAVVTNEDSFKLAEKFQSFFHAILVDAPCSGEGMFRKNPEAVNEWSPNQVLVCAKRQSEILHNAAQMLMPGGNLVYSTCTFSKEENEDVISQFLEEHSDFVLEERDVSWFAPSFLQAKGAYRLWPHMLKGEGHFVAVLRKAGVLNQAIEPVIQSRKKKIKLGLTKEKLKYFQEFLEQTMSDEVANWIDPERMAEFGEQLYLLPKGCPDLSGIHVLRAGLHLGEFKKNRFEPSHALAITLSTCDVKNYIDLTIEDDRAYSYFMGESIFVNNEDRLQGKKGWCLVCIDGYSAGWGKIAGGTIKNHYPKGLRKDLRKGTI